MDGPTPVEDENLWTVHGRKFDLTDFIKRHPGGPHSINLGRGRDATHLVDAYHPHSDKVWEVIMKYEVPASKKAHDAAVAAGARPAAWPPRDPFYEDCKKEVRKMFPGGAAAAKATWEPFLLLGLLGTPTVYGLLWYAANSGSCLAAFASGVLFVVVNARLLHEAGHFGLSTNWMVNRAICLFWAVPTLCATSWDLQHVLSHHQYTNSLPADLPEPERELSSGGESEEGLSSDGASDSDGEGAKAKSTSSSDGKKAAAAKAVAAKAAAAVLPAQEQSVPYDIDSSSFDGLAEVSKNFPAWAWPLVLVVGIPIIWAKSPLTIGSGYALEILTEGRVEQQQMRPFTRTLDAGVTLLVQAAIITYMTCTIGFLSAIAVWMSYLFGNGMIFITFSQVSHIPDMVRKWRPTVPEFEKRGWAASQVEHSMNFAMASKFAFYISFGLNFQIEHHLFPSVSHDHLPKLSAAIRKVCAKHGVRYWSEPSMSKALKILWESLVDMRGVPTSKEGQEALKAAAAKRMN